MDHHWQEGLRPDPDNNFGFIYEVRELDTGRRYIGLKQYWFSAGNAKRRVHDVLHPRWTPHHWKPSDWRTYTTSSKELNEAMAKKGLDNYEFCILAEYTNKRDLLYAEVETILKADALTLVDSEGEYIYYNKRADKAFRPPMTVSEETRDKIGRARKGKTHSPEAREKIAEAKRKTGPCIRCGSDDWRQRRTPSGFQRVCRVCKKRSDKEYRERKKNADT
jgi:hypothetical protein